MSEDGTPPPILVLFLATIISLAIFAPLTGVLVRFRANYNPKGLQLDSEGGAAPHTGPVVNSYFQMFLRTYKLEVRCSGAVLPIYARAPYSAHTTRQTDSLLGSPRTIQRTEYAILRLFLSF